MGGLMSRNKGKRAERDVLEIMQTVLDEVYHAHGREAPKLKRNTLQSDSGGDDIHGLDWMAPEVKHQETFQLNSWWDQCLRQAGTTKEPVLFYRRNRVPWAVRLRLRAHVADCEMTVTATVDIDTFIVWFRLKLMERLEGLRYGEEACAS